MLITETYKEWGTDLCIVQVVAGMNYAFTAEAQYDCQPLPLQEKDLIATDIFSLLAIGHQPLGDTSPEVCTLSISRKADLLGGKMSGRGSRQE